MTANKSMPAGSSAADFLDRTIHPEKKADAHHLLQIRRDLTGGQVIWVPSLDALGHYHFRYDRGRGDNIPRTGIFSRARNFSLYADVGASYHYPLLKQLKIHGTGKACL